MRILTIVPTRGRPWAASVLAERYDQTRSSTDTQLLFALDQDDPSLTEYQTLLIDRGLCDYQIGPRLRMGPTLNLYATREADTHHWDVIGFMGDDHRPRTPGWDVRFGQALRDAPGVAYGDDRIHGPNLPTAAWVSAKIVRQLGYMAPPALIHLFLDNFWLELGHATHLHYFPDVVVEHLHPIAGKADWDAGYIEVNSGVTQEHDKAEFDRYMTYDWPIEQARLSM